MLHNCPVRCFSCGCDLAILYPDFKLLLDAHMAKYGSNTGNVHPTNLDMAAADDIDFGYIFEFFDLTNYCCRTFLKTFTDETQEKYRGILDL